MFVFPLLALFPGVLSAQGSLRIAPPSVRLTLGPISVRATLGTAEPAVHAIPGSSRASATAARILTTADAHVGTRYTYGGETPRAGFDCSGFVQYVFARHGINLPRTSRQQGTAGWKLPPGTASLRPGDLMLFSTTGGLIDHVAIYAGNGRILHSSRSAGGVGYDDLTSSRGRWFLERHVSSRRVI